MKVQLVFLASFACLATSQQADDNLDALIEGVFGKPDQERGPPKTPDQIDINNGQPEDNGSVNPGNVDQEGCQCVPYYQCANGTINSDGVGLIDIRQVLTFSETMK